MFANLYISRVVLNVLGVTDFGIYNVVTGLVIMLTMVTGTLSSAISRFLNYDMGKNGNNLNIIYSSSITFHIILAVIITSFGWIFSQYIIYDFINIPVNREDSALIVFYCAIISFSVTLCSVTFNALIIAHEDMKVYSGIGIVEIIFKLISLNFLQEITYDKLELYSFLFMLGVFLSFVLNFTYAKIFYNRIKFTFKMDKKIFFEICKFSGWNSIGVSSSILKDQGVNILLNMFFGAQINAARAISFQVNSAVSSVVNQLMLAINPRITKLLSSNEVDESINLAFNSSRYSFYFLLLLSTPLLIEVDNILNFWLVHIPEYSAVFIRLLIINLLIDSLSGPIITLMLANGRIRNYQIVVGIVNGLNFPISYLFLTLGYGPQATIIISIFISIINLYLRVYMLSKEVSISINDFFFGVVVNTFLISIFVFLISLFCSQLINYLFISGFYTMIINIVVTTFFSLIIIMLGLKDEERKFILNKITHFYKLRFNN
jgi:O-antigen/teichoic acid export membrane protein